MQGGACGGENAVERGGRVLALTKAGMLALNSKHERAAALFGLDAPPLRLKGGVQSAHGKGPAAGVNGGGEVASSPRSGDVVVRRRVFTDKIAGWRPVKASSPLPESWKCHPDPGDIVATVPAAVERALDAHLGLSGRGVGGKGVGGGGFVGRGLHEWKEARLVVGEWRADEQRPFQAAEARPAVNASQNQGPEQTCALHLRAEAGARTWGMWFTEPESGGSLTRLSCAYSTEDDEEVLMDIWGRPWTFDSCQVRCAGGIAMQLAKWAEASCNACGIGGLDGGDRHHSTGEWVVESQEMASGHPARCTHGCRVYDVAALNLSNSTVEYSGLVHAALRACDASRVAVQGCHITDNSIGVIVERDTFLTVVDSR